MRTIGLLGGMSWQSTTSYYQTLNELVSQRLGGLHSAAILLHSFDFAPIEVLQNEGRWDEATAAMIDAARGLEAAGAACLLICSNTMHLMADEVAQALEIPLLHIADITAAALNRRGANAPLLLATRYTMEQDFYRSRLLSHGVQAVIPDAQDRRMVNQVIFDELCLGLIRPESKAAWLEVVTRMTDQGADSVIFGCTEVALLLQPNDIALPCFDTTALHAQAAVDFALS
jgi:aspartate racemase